MSSGTALSAREVGVGTAGAGRVGVAHERHLRVLPPVPRAYRDPASGTRRAPSPTVPRPASPSSRPPIGRAGSAPLRLTARGRRVVAALLLLVALGAVALVDSFAGAGGGGLQLMGTASTVVEPGDTLWSIASDVAGARDVRQVIDEIQLLNGLESASIEPGQVLRLP